MRAWGYQCRPSPSAFPCLPPAVFVWNPPVHCMSNVLFNRWTACSRTIPLRTTTQILRRHHDHHHRHRLHLRKLLQLPLLLLFLLLPTVPLLARGRRLCHPYPPLPGLAAAVLRLRGVQWRRRKLGHFSSLWPRYSMSCLWTMVLRIMQYSSTVHFYSFGSVGVFHFFSSQSTSAVAEAFEIRRGGYTP